MDIDLLGSALGPPLTAAVREVSHQSLLPGIHRDRQLPAGQEERRRSIKYSTISDSIVRGRTLTFFKMSIYARSGRLGVTEMFQSAPPYGERPDCPGHRHWWRRFQSAPSYGERATSGTSGPWTIAPFQSAPSYGERPSTFLTASEPRSFQSAPSYGERPGIAPELAALHPVSIRALLRRATLHSASARA